MWKNSILDELEGHYKEKRGEVSISSAKEEELEEQEAAFHKEEKAEDQ